MAGYVDSIHANYSRFAGKCATGGGHNTTGMSGIGTRSWDLVFKQTKCSSLPFEYIEQEPLFLGKLYFN